MKNQTNVEYCAVTKRTYKIQLDISTELYRILSNSFKVHKLECMQINKFTLFNNNMLL